MSETVVQAFERMAKEHLDNPDVNVIHESEKTAVKVTHYGGKEALRRLESAHGYVSLDPWTVQEGGISIGDGSTTALQTSSGTYTLQKDAHSPYRTGGSASSVSGSSSTAPATSGGEGKVEETASQDEEQAERAWGDGLENPPEPSRRYTELPDGSRHAIANWPEETDNGPFVCDESFHDGRMGAVKDNYDSLIHYAADPDLCETCARTIIQFYNLSVDEVMQLMEEEYDG